MDAWVHGDFLCRNYILNGLSDTLYNVYSSAKTARALWESLEKKYKTEDAGLKKFIVGKFLEFKMVDSKTVMNQVQEFQMILHDLHAEGMTLSESFQVAAMIEKLPPLWKDFKNYLKHKRKEMGLEDLIVRLRIEEDNRLSEMKSGRLQIEAKANLMEQNETSHKESALIISRKRERLKKKEKEIATIVANPIIWPRIADFLRKSSACFRGGTQDDLGKGAHFDRCVARSRHSKELSVWIAERKEEGSSRKRTHEVASGDHQRDEEPRRSKRAKIAKTFGPEFLTYVLENEPRTINEALSSPEAPFWKEAINSEIESIMQNHTWELMDLPPGSTPLGCKWILKRKYKADGSIDKYKARLVAKGFKQKEGLDFFDTYSPVTRITSIRVLIAIAALYDLEIHQMDVKTAFLNGELDEEIYMNNLKGLSFLAKKRRSADLSSLYMGLNKLLNNGMKSLTGQYDMLIMGSNRDVILTTKRMLTKHFDMKDMGLADVILGIKISKTSDGLALSQSHYIENILKKFKAYDSPPAKTPVDLNLHLAKNKGESEGQIEYSRIIGSLMYIMNCTRPDIAYAVNKLSRFTSNPSKNHWKGLIRVLRYLKYTSNYGLHYTRYPAVLEGYSDANWISDSKDTKSTSGYVFTIGGGAVSWKSSKQTCIARSTMESEFIALDKAGEEAEWLRNFLEDIPCWTKPVPAIMIHCDSQSAIGRAQSGMYNGKSRHIRRRHNTIRQLISSGIISIDYIKSKENLADPLTKGLSRDQVYCLSRGMGLKPDN
ncbi:UNVERIFIED_CONTAM: Retrovirus-related Pol polyprotein from transposon TNT 1-94 [Sesamum radiatum]|uniref:Retrovirus-related Pol polyprotein from transposon TNT 1-94 n=1 Tax=Sesamum radiatum TaxID=300843 RepID=A0AAW2TCY9_SESRA